MSGLRFPVGASVMCNMGPNGWKLGRIIALHYREEHWPTDREAPYQVALEDDHTLIYVPEDDDRCCRKPTNEDLRIARRTDALATLPPGLDSEPTHSGPADSQLSCEARPAQPGSAGYRSGRCHCCDCCPRNWTAVELYSEHYRCAARNGLRVTHHAVDLGTVRVGDPLHHPPSAATSEGFMQSPTLVRLPPGLHFSDDGALVGEVRFDPHRDPAYEVEFVAVSTACWDDPAVGLVRLEIRFVVEGNQPPEGFDIDAFVHEQRAAQESADRVLHNLIDAWGQWEQGELSNPDTCERMLADLAQLRHILGLHPRLDGGRWWALLGGFHMNVHKLLENTLFECELYLGHALTFWEPEVRIRAEQNLEGCYQKRQLEAARFMWIDGVEQMMRGEWAAAARTLSHAAAKKDGWGWAVNYGDIWMAEAAARLIHGAQLAARDGAEDGEASQWIEQVARLLDKSIERVEDAGAFGPGGHPWASELDAALASYSPHEMGFNVQQWLDAFESRTVYWCAQVLAGAPPFPPKPRPRLKDAAELERRLSGCSTDRS